MLIPDALRALLADGLVQEVVRPLKSGKEASVFIVVAEHQQCAAKVYKQAHQRNFRQRQDYVEGRTGSDTRTQRAMGRGSRFGRQASEEAWQTAEVRAMHTLAAAGVRIPRPRALHEGGILLMDLVCGRDGQPAAQIATVRYRHDEAVRTHLLIMHQIASMLRVGVVHADLSEFNILNASDGPIIIDFPQAVDAARNNNAKRLLLRDVANVTRFFARFAPELRRTQYGEEMWLLHEHAQLRPDTVLSGRFQAARGTVDAQVVLRAIEEAKEEAAKREEVKRWREERRRPGH